jgi:hypothetical protein
MASTTGTNPISDLMRDRLRVLQSKAGVLHAYEKYNKNAERERATECVEMFRKRHEQDAWMVEESRDHVMEMMKKHTGR